MWEKCLLESFSALNLVSNGVKFPIFGFTKLEIWFSKYCHIKLKISDFLRNELLRTSNFLLRLIVHFKLYFMDDTSSLVTITPSFLKLDSRWNKPLLMRFLNCLTFLLIVPHFYTWEIDHSLVSCLWFPWVWTLRMEHFNSSDS